MATEEQSCARDDDDIAAQFRRQLHEAMERDGALNSTPKEEARPRPDVEKLYFKGTLTEQVEFQLSVLTQAISDCMVFATGAFPDLTEGPQMEQPSRGNRYHAASFARPVTFAAARSMQLNDAARLSEATARLLTGFSKIRSQFGQDFTMRYSESRDAKGKPRQVTTLTHRFSLPREQSSQEAIGATKEALERVRANVCNA